MCACSDSLTHLRVRLSLTHLRVPLSPTHLRVCAQSPQRAVAAAVGRIRSANAGGDWADWGGVPVGGLRRSQTARLASDLSDSSWAPVGPVRLASWAPVGIASDLIDFSWDTYTRLPAAGMPSHAFAFVLNFVRACARARVCVCVNGLCVRVRVAQKKKKK